MILIAKRSAVLRYLAIQEEGISKSFKHLLHDTRTMLTLSFLTGPPRTLMGLTHDDIRRTLSIGSDNDPFDYSSSPFPCPPDLDPYAIDKLELPGSPTVQFDNFLGGHIRPAKHEHHDIFNFTEGKRIIKYIGRIMSIMSDDLTVLTTTELNFDKIKWSGSSRWSFGPNSA